MLEDLAVSRIRKGNAFVANDLVVPPAMGSANAQ